VSKSFLRKSKASGSTVRRVEKMVRQGSRRVRRALYPWQRRELERGEYAL